MAPSLAAHVDCLALLPTPYQGRERAALYQVRTLVGIQPLLQPRVHLVLNTEPFVYRTDGWLAEIRLQVGVQLRPVAHLTVQALYWNWWAGYESRRVDWQHTIYLTATLALGRGGPPP